MRLNPIPLITLLLLITVTAAAQPDSRFQIQLRSGNFIPVKNIDPASIQAFNQTVAKTAGKSFVIIQFEELPSVTIKEQLKANGIELLEYIPNNAFTATISGQPDANEILQSKARALIVPQPEQKMQPELSRGIFPNWALKNNNQIELWISFPSSFNFETVQQELYRKGFQITSTLNKNYRILELIVATDRLTELAAMPCIDYVQAAPAPVKEFNTNSMAASKANMLKASIANGGLGLTGQGVVVGVGDNGDIQTHLDFTGRIINRAGDIPRAHATHVAGTVGGAGIINELHEGYAPKSTILSQLFNNIITKAPTYVQDNGMVIGSHSYGLVADDCAFNGIYDLNARILDQQAIDLPELQHVFAAGNDGFRTCSPFPSGFRTVMGGFQCAKNIITVGATDYKRDWATFSSKGPVRDGRVKPEIMSQGERVASTWSNNQYSFNNGTSMAAPGVSGGLALLIERYRTTHGNANPKNGLLKALLCNGASDRGNAGPDFTYGFGSMNLVRSLAMMEANHYFTNTVAQNITNTHTISVPANTAQLKVLLYWNDPAASVMAAHTLVNNLNLSVTGPGGTVLPYVLDTLSSNVNNAATATGNDAINNIEQVVINNPAAGSYDLKANGAAIAAGPSQGYFLVYDAIPQSLVLTNPVGGEHLIPSVPNVDSFIVNWESYSDETNTFTLEFSSNNGGSWTTLSNNLPAAIRHYAWTVPNTPTDVAKLRLTKNTTGFSQTSNAFVITELPVVTLSAVQCEGYISINWNAVPAATDYEVMRLIGNEMVSVATTTSLSYNFSGLSKDSVYWVTVRARINGHPGRRAIAISRQPNTGTCAGSISDNDLKLDTIISPITSGRIFTSTALGNNVPITIRIKNLDDIASSGNINVSYSINGGPAINEVITAPTANIPALNHLDYTFATNANLSAVGSYTILATATKAGDAVTINNSFQNVYKQLDNQPITNAQLPWIDNLESTPGQTVTENQMGLTGNDRYDFLKSSTDGRLRSYINSGIAYSGSKAITLDVSKYISGGNINSLTATFNLSAFNIASDDIRIDFRYKNHNQQPNSANQLWIRGSDMSSWIPVYDLYANQNPADGSYKLSSSIELADSLAVYGQAFSSSTQARWGQWGQYMTADNEGGAGYSFDDIRIYRAVDDVQAIRLDTPVVVACGLNNAVPVKLKVRNSKRSAINNIPVVLRVDGNIIANETITFIAANSSIQYTFTATANLSAPGNHLVEAWVDYATDNVRQNDTAKVNAYHLPLIASFPYLENFETNNGYWYAGGNLSTWNYGTPNSAKITRAASGNKVWKTNLNGYYTENENSYLYSPCFNLSSMSNPTLSFSLALDVEDCGATYCDGAWVEYSNDGGTTWNKLGTQGSGTNWYNKNYSGNQLWSQQDYTRWHVATSALPTTNNSNIRFRFVISSDPGVTKEGIAIDDVHVYDDVNGIYDITGSSPVVNQNVSGTSWIHFIEPVSGKIIASINPNNQNMGSTDVQSYIYAGPVRVNGDQYYHNRNITMKPANKALADSATVRFYFTDAETEALINASGCSNCYKPAMAYELGVTKYSDPTDVSKENGTLSDNTPGNYLFINNGKIKFTPFDKGYYAEFKVKNFSEFWLNNGGFDNNSALPVQLINFLVTKTNNNDVLAKWTVENESNLHHYEIEVAKGNSNYQLNQFVKLGEVAAANSGAGIRHYSFSDLESNKSGVRYYRLKMVDNDGRYSYSNIRPLVFSNEIKWQAYPNPTNGMVTLTYQSNAGEKVQLRIFEAGGKQVQQQQLPATGFIQQATVQLPAAGIYLIELKAGEQKQSFRIVKQ